MPRVRINFAISDELKEWIKQQPNILDIVEQSNHSITIEHNMTGPQAQATKAAFLDKLIEVVQ